MKPGLKISSTEDLAYIAGFFDGEGYVEIARRKEVNSIRIAATIGNTDIRPLQFIQERFGGSICVASRAEKLGKRRIYQWRAGAKIGESFLNAILPFAIIKRDRIELALALRKTIGPGGRATDEQYAKRDEIFSKLTPLFRARIKVA